MKSFLLKEKKPLIKWAMLPHGVYFEFKGKLPSSYSLAVCPSAHHIVVDVDRHGKIDGFDNVPLHILEELQKSLNYPTKNNGRHFWLESTSKKELANKASGLGIDLRVGNKGYVVWYPEEDPRDCMELVKKSSVQMNDWLESLFSYC